MKNKLTIGILAHVDAGKTTLSETILYLTGRIRKMGRVDHKDAFLDTFALEKDRGITIFSKQAVFDLGQVEVTLLDTPGHVDFSTEMERTLQVLDYAILVVSAKDGVQGHTQTLWRLLKTYGIPVFIFVNKMDQAGTNRDYLLEELKASFGDGCIAMDNVFSSTDSMEELAMCDEKLLELYLEDGEITSEELCQPIVRRSIFPVYFGSALKNQGVKDLLEGLRRYMLAKTYPDKMGARIFKISRDEQGNRLTHVKMTGGSIKVKDLIQREAEMTVDGQYWEEKIDQIRIYSGNQYESIQEAGAGTICALIGLTRAKAGEGLGFEQNAEALQLKPILNYQINLPDQVNVHTMLKNLKELEEEEPHLNVVWNERLGEIHVRVMGEIEIEILKSMILNRYGVSVTFDSGTLLYKETISSRVEGVGHFEPLRHYAEVHLVMEPLQRGQGLQFESDCSEDILGKNWQHLVLTHLQEKKHVGVLTGSEITDMKIRLVTGRAHEKHTEGGDFRQATYRAIRHGLMKAQNILLEPMYAFRMELESSLIGRAMSDVQRMYGSHESPIIEEDMAILKGRAPVATMMHYPMEFVSYTKGQGRIFLSSDGYDDCHDSEAVIEAIGYDPEEDQENPTGSVFCKKGVGFQVPWFQVEDYMHLESVPIDGRHLDGEDDVYSKDIEAGQSFEPIRGITEDEVEAIFRRTYGPKKERTYNRGPKVLTGKDKSKTESENPVKVNKNKTPKSKERYLLVDGYNIIFAWEELNKLSKSHLDSARTQLLEILSNYKSQILADIIVVFDAYRVEGNGSSSKYHNIYVVYTKEAETADQYIEKFVHNTSGKYDVSVATSDGLEQVIIMGKGAHRLSAEDLRQDVVRTKEKIHEKIRENYMSEHSKIGPELKIDLIESDKSNQEN